MRRIPMAAKKKSKKTVTITVDEDTLKALGQALGAASKHAGAAFWAEDAPAPKAARKKKPKGA
jgi:hypothetical protein